MNFSSFISVVILFLYTSNMSTILSVILRVHNHDKKCDGRQFNCLTCIIYVTHFSHDGEN